MVFKRFCRGFCRGFRRSSNFVKSGKVSLSTNLGVRNCRYRPVQPAEVTSGLNALVTAAAVASWSWIKDKSLGGEYPQWKFSPSGKVARVDRHGIHLELTIDFTPGCSIDEDSVSSVITSVLDRILDRIVEELGREMSLGLSVILTMSDGRQKEGVVYPKKWINAVGLL